MGESEKYSFSTGWSGALFTLVIGLFFLLRGLGNSGIIWDNYAIWSPVSTMVTILICVAVYFILYNYTIRAGRLSAIPEISGIQNRMSVIFILLLLIGIPVVTVITRGVSLDFDPAALFVGITIFAVMVRNYGFQSLLLSSIFVIPALLPMAGFSMQDNPNNPNLMPPYLYSVLTGIVLMLWIILLYLRMRPPAKQTETA